MILKTTNLRKVYGKNETKVQALNEMSGPH